MGEEQNNLLNLDELVGQEPIKQRLSLIAKTFCANSETPGHMLFEGPPGSGRLTFAQAFAKSLGTSSVLFDGKSIDSPELAALCLDGFKARTVFIVENAEYLKAPVMAKFAETFQTGQVSLTLLPGTPAERTYRRPLGPLTVILISNASSHIPESVRNTTTFKFNFHRYSPAEMERICVLHARQLDLTFTTDEIQAICNASSGMAGRLIKSLREIRSFMTVSDGSSSINRALDALGITGSTKTDLVDLQQLSGIEFEQRICELLGSMGFQTQMTRASGDGGIDIIARMNQPILGGRYLIQCKRFAVGNTVGAPYVRDFFGALKADPLAVKGIFITTSIFTEQARRFAQQVGIELIDSAALAELFSKYCF